MELRGALVVVGGGSRGIGAGVARAMAARGARQVVLLARRPGPLEAVAAAIGSRARWPSVDLSDAERAAAVARTIVAESGVPDIVVASSSSCSRPTRSSTRFSRAMGFASTSRGRRASATRTSAGSQCSSRPTSSTGGSMRRTGRGPSASRGASASRSASSPPP